MENKNFSVKCFLPAFYIVVLGLAVLLELFASRVYVSLLLIMRIIHVFTHVQFFFRDAVALL